ncbi:unnamed protein product, partial [Meganyctiphanes norvegica]
VTLLDQTDSTDRFNIRASYIDSNTDKRFRRIGTWWLSDNGSGQSYTSEPLTHDLMKKYRNFQGRELILAMNNNWPFFGIKKLSNGTIVPDAGIDMHILNSLGERYNFTYKIQHPAD